VTRIDEGRVCVDQKIKPFRINNAVQPSPCLSAVSKSDHDRVDDMFARREDLK